MTDNKIISRTRNEADGDFNEAVIDDYDYLGASCSATDCTGLIPRGGSTEAEREAYEELYPYQPRPVPEKNGKSS